MSEPPRDCRGGSLAHMGKEEGYLLTYGSTKGPYASAAWAYREAGWTGVIPLPAGRKDPPPARYTGWAGIEPSGADIQAWIDGSHGAGNVALHLREGVIGIDVDAYSGKGGGQALADLTARAGTPLPPTWISTSRSDQVSGIRLFRAYLPAGRVWLDQPAGLGAGIEMVHRGHRYAVVWPSIHPTGAQYAWVVESPELTSSPMSAVPRADDIPWLPAEWVEVLSRPGEALEGVALDVGAAGRVIDAFAHADVRADACMCVTSLLSDALTHFAGADGEALHPTMNASLRALIGYGIEGHRGVPEALAEHHDRFVTARAGLSGGRGASEDAARREWLRSACGAVGKLAGPGWTAPPDDPCAGLLFDPGIPPPGELTAVEPAGDVGAVEPASANPSGGSGMVDPVQWVLDQMLTPDQVCEMPRPRALVGGLLSLDSVAWLVAAPGSYKSFVALDLAAAIAAGRPWMDRRTHQGSVVYMAAEGASGMSLRIAAHQKHYGAMGDVRLLPLPLQVGDARQWGALVEACRRMQPAPVLIVLDTQARITVGLKENDSTDMGILVDAMETLRRATGACVLAVHHTPKDGQGLRGSGALGGAANTVLELVKKDRMRAVLTSSKQKDIEDGAEIMITLERVDLGVDVETGDPLSSLVIAGSKGIAHDYVPDWVANLTENQSVLVGVMADIFPDIGGTKSEIRREVRRRVRPSDRQPLTDSSFQRAWDRLVFTEKFIQVKGSSRFVLASLHQEPDVPDVRRPSPADILGALPFQTG